MGLHNTKQGQGIHPWKMVKTHCVALDRIRACRFLKATVLIDLLPHQIAL